MARDEQDSESGADCGQPGVLSLGGWSLAGSSQPGAKDACPWLSRHPTDGAWASWHIPPGAGEASLLLFSGVQTVGTQAPSDRCVVYVVSCAGAGPKATGHLHGMETTFQFPLTNGRFHFHSPPFPITFTPVSPLHLRSLVLDTPAFLCGVCVLPACRAPKGSTPHHASCFLPNPVPTPHSQLMGSPTLGGRCLGACPGYAPNLLWDLRLLGHQFSHMYYGGF